MSDALRTRPWTTQAMFAVYSDRTTLRHALLFEGELARAQAAAGLMPNSVAEDIADACNSIEIDAAALADEMALAGSLAIPLVARLRTQLATHSEAAAAVHRGATSQDLADTIMMIQARDAASLINADLKRISHSLGQLAREHAETPALGRTLLQDAAPITLGLRIAQWLSGIEDARRRLEFSCREGLLLQFGGGVGSRAGLGGKADVVAERLATALGLPPSPPWHARRSHISAVASALGIVAGALGKMAHDIGFLAATAIGELREPKIEGRGSSSAMPHKRNPTGCQIALSAAMRAPGLVAILLTAMPQELERGLGGWQAEAPVLAELFMLVGGSAEAMTAVAEGLEVDIGAIQRNLAVAGVGEDAAESAALVKVLLNQYGSID